MPVLNVSMAANMFGKMNSFHNKIPPVLLWKCKHFLQHSRIRRFHEGPEQQQQQRAGSSTFDSWIENHRLCAKRSIVVKIHSKQSVEELHGFCSAYAPVSRIFYYSLSNPEGFALVEFNSEEEMRQVVKNAKHAHENPVHSQFFYFDAIKNKHRHKENKNVGFYEYTPPKITDVDGKLQNAENITQQMRTLYEETRVSEFGTRIRFMVCMQIESALSGIFPNGEVKPFGSSVNGLGKFSCDLDMVYDMECQYLSQGNSTSPLKFQPPFRPATTLNQFQQNLDVLKYFIRCFVPCCTEVLGILGARVPIVKFKHTFTGLECDLSNLNLTGVYMSELLYLYGECDERVRPMVFTVLRWAKENNITRDIAGGNWFTNFHLILLVMYFLQQKPHNILPPLKTLRALAGKEDVRVTQGVDCTFLRNKTWFPRSKDDSTLHELLVHFFEFWSTFDFSDRKISLIDGCPKKKAARSSVEIENPLEPNLNAAQIVSRLEMKNLQSKMQDAALILDSDGTFDSSKPWGILSTFKPFTETRKSFNVESVFPQSEKKQPDRKPKKVNDSDIKHIYVTK